MSTTSRIETPITISVEQELNPWQSQAARFDYAAQKLNLDEGLWKILRYPAREIIVHIPVLLDNGRMEVFTGYRVQHSIARGPAKGGVRYSPYVTLDEIGKPVNTGGSRGRREATGRGVMIVCDEALKKLNMEREGCRVIIQGFGNVGSNAAQLMYQDGYKIIGIIEINGSLHNRNGINIDELIEYKKKNNTIVGFPGAGAADGAELMTTECDILAPCATENVITSKNADRIKCKILCEGANGPTTAVADDILAEKKVFIIPDILANAGGGTTSYFAWGQERQGYFWKEAVGNEQLESIIKEAFEDLV